MAMMIKENDPVLQELIDIAGKESEKKPATQPPVAPPLISLRRKFTKNPSDIVDRVKQDPKGKQLLSGEINSETTLAFCNLLKLEKYCAGNTDLMEECIKLTPFYREKWEEKRGDSTWGKGQIKRALEGYDPNFRKQKEVEPQVFQESPVGVPKLWNLRTLKDAYKERPPTQYVVDKLFAIPSLNIVYGAPGTLKSMLLSEAAVCIASGQPWLTGLPTEESKDVKAFRTIKAPVLWIDYDNGQRRTDERFEALAKDRGLSEDAPVHYVSMADPWLKATDGMLIARLVTLIIEIKAKFVVIDNLGLISGDADENSADMTEVMGNLRKLAEWSGSAVVIIHHQRKGSMADRQGDLLRGHSSIEAALDLALLVNREKQDSRLTITPTKVRGASIASSFGAEFTYTHKPGTHDLATAKFFGVAIATAKEIENQEIANAVTIVLNRLYNKGEPVDQKRLVEVTQSYIETDTEIKKPGRDKVRGIIEMMVDDGRIKTDRGDKNSLLYYPPT